MGKREANILRTPESPFIRGGAGHIGRAAIAECIDRGVTPSGIVLTERRLVNEETRRQTAEEIATNFTPDGEQVVLEGVELSDVLHIGDIEIPVFTDKSEHELLAEGHPVIEATGQDEYKERMALEGLLEAGASSVTVTSPIHERHNVQGVVYGVNSTEANLQKAAHDRLVSTSSCTTTAVTSLLGPLLKNENFSIKEALVNVSHARTKSNKSWEIEDNIALSSSGAVKEIPKILDAPNGELAFDLSCIRANASCGSMFELRVRMNPEGDFDETSLQEEIMRTLTESDSVLAIDDELRETKSVIGRKESVIVNSSQIKITRKPDGAIEVRFIGFYDNVNGYTRSMADTHEAFVEAVRL